MYMLGHQIPDTDSDEWRQWRFIAIRAAFDVLHGVEDEPTIRFHGSYRLVDGINKLSEGDAEPLEAASFSIQQALGGVGSN
jgi:hypothetical protein